MATAIPQPLNFVMPDGTTRRWDPANEPKPSWIGNDSRDHFLYNCYSHPLGKFFQDVIKGRIVSMIRWVHDSGIPRYDKEAFVFDDPRLQLLNQIITDAIEEQIQDSDKDRKQKILSDCRDISLFMLKEDIFYRPRILQAIISASRKVIENEAILMSLTDTEARNLAQFGCLDGKTHPEDFSDLPMEERMKLPKHWTGLP
jgi:hypothetical protein